jgi:hypothetical protein
MIDEYCSPLGVLDPCPVEDRLGMIGWDVGVHCSLPWLASFYWIEICLNRVRKLG